MHCHDHSVFTMFNESVYIIEEFKKNKKRVTLEIIANHLCINSKLFDYIGDDEKDHFKFLETIEKDLKDINVSVRIMSKSKGDTWRYVIILTPGARLPSRFWSNHVSTAR